MESKACLMATRDPFLADCYLDCCPLSDLSHCSQSSLDTRSLTNMDTLSRIDSYPYPYSHSNSNRNPYSNSNADSNTYSYCYACSHTNICSYTNASSRSMQIQSLRFGLLSKWCLASGKGSVAGHHPGRKATRGVYG